MLSPSPVILSEAKDLSIPLRVNFAKHLLFRALNNLQDSSSPAAPQNDANAVFFNKLLHEMQISLDGDDPGLACQLGK